MALSSIFKIRKEATPALLELLNSTTLGTNGAMYRHLDTSNRIKEADSPIFLSIERNEKVIGNITFCQRESFWYIRYFAFHSFVQASSNKKKDDKGNSFLKRELSLFFNDVFAGKYSETKIDSLYAYIDPKNDRSKWMSENFGFLTIGQLVTQSYSRLYPKKSSRLEILHNWNEIKSIVQNQYGHHNYFYTTHAEKPPFYVIRNSEMEIIAFTRITRVHWEIVRLPGKFGGFLTKIIPYLPLFNKLIKPKNHTFLVPEIVHVKDNDPKLLNELFSGILAQEKVNLLLWWIDRKDPLYKNVNHSMHWGILHKLIGISPVDVVQKTSDGKSKIKDEPIFVSAYDMV